MKIIDVLLVSDNVPPVIAKGVPVKVGVIDDLFAATHKWMNGNYFETDWNITHIPSGLCHSACAFSPQEAVAHFTSEILRLGKERYQKRINNAMKRRRAIEKAHPEWFSKIKARAA